MMELLGERFNAFKDLHLTTLWRQHRPQRTHPDDASHRELRERVRELHQNIDSQGLVASEQP